MKSDEFGLGSGPKRYGIEWEVADVAVAPVKITFLLWQFSQIEYARDGRVCGSLAGAILTVGWSGCAAFLELPPTPAGARIVPSDLSPTGGHCRIGTGSCPPKRNVSSHARQPDSAPVVSGTCEKRFWEVFGRALKGADGGAHSGCPSVPRPRATTPRKRGARSPWRYPPRCVGVRGACHGHERFLDPL
jgi:hypothetical protein